MNRYLDEVILKILQQRKLSLVGFTSPKKSEAFELVCKIKKETSMLLTFVEAVQIYNSVRNSAKIIGDLAEVGVFKGGSAKLICEAKGNRTLHLFDTFEGLPELSKLDAKEQFYKKKYSCPIDDVKSYLKQYPNVHFLKGLFPETANPVTNTKFCFVHLDVDLYESTKNCISFFYSRMTKGGIIISHDYAYAKGVHVAFDEFFKDKPEAVIELADSQCMVVKL
jgi:O-methyltransferase